MPSFFIFTMIYNKRTKKSWFSERQFITNKQRVEALGDGDTNLSAIFNVSTLNIVVDAALIETCDSSVLAFVFVINLSIFIHFIFCLQCGGRKNCADAGGRKHISSY